MDIVHTTACTLAYYCAIFHTISHSILRRCQGKAYYYGPVDIVHTFSSPQRTNVARRHRTHHSRARPHAVRPLASYTPFPVHIRIQCVCERLVLLLFDAQCVRSTQTLVLRSLPSPPYWAVVCLGCGFHQVPIWGEEFRLILGCLSGGACQTTGGDGGRRPQTAAGSAQHCCGAQAAWQGATPFASEPLLHSS